MKKSSMLSILIALVCLMSCSKNETTSSLQGKWHVVNISGGFAGVNCNYERDSFVWTFDDSNLTRVTDFITMDQFCSLGNSIEENTFVVLTDDGKEYLQIDNIVFGQITLSGDTLSINTNNTIGGEGTDGFSYVLIK